MYAYVSCCVYMYVRMYVLLSLHAQYMCVCVWYVCGVYVLYSAILRPCRHVYMYVCMCVPDMYVRVCTSQRNAARFHTLVKLTRTLAPRLLKADNLQDMDCSVQVLSDLLLVRGWGLGLVELG